MHSSFSDWQFEQWFRFSDSSRQRFVPTLVTN